MKKNMLRLLSINKNIIYTVTPFLPSSYATLHLMVCEFERDTQAPVIHSSWCFPHYRIDMAGQLSQT